MGLIGNRYVLKSLLGQGGMASVYLCEDVTLNRKVALKVTSAGTEFAEALEAEAKIWATLSHPNIAQVYDFFLEGKSCYLVLEYVAGSTLEQFRNSPASEVAVLHYCNQLVEALHYLHSQNPPVIFRDLTPRNVMLQDDGKLKLIDFGISKQQDSGQLTRTAARGMGSSGYAPLEQYARNGVTDHRSDIYALGAVLFFLLTGNDPPDAPERVQHSVDPLEPLLAPLPMLMKCLVRELMAVKQSERIMTASDIAQRLQVEKTKPLHKVAVAVPMSTTAATANNSVGSKLQKQAGATVRTVDSGNAKLQPQTPAEQGCLFLFLLLAIGLSPLLLSSVFSNPYLVYYIYCPVWIGGTAILCRYCKNSCGCLVIALVSLFLGTAIFVGLPGPFKATSMEESLARSRQR